MTSRPKTFSDLLFQHLSNKTHSELKQEAFSLDKNVLLMGCKYEVTEWRVRSASTLRPVIHFNRLGSDPELQQNHPADGVSSAARCSNPHLAAGPVRTSRHD